MQLIVADFADLLSNGCPPLAAYRAMMSSWIIALDKHTGVITVGVGETWQRLMEKCFLWVMGQEDKAACGTEHLSGCVEAGIEGGIHIMILLWQQHSQ